MENQEHLTGSPFNQETVELVAEYRQLIGSVFADDSLSEDERETLLVEAGQWYQKNVLEGGYTDNQIAFAWFANSPAEEETK